MNPYEQYCKELEQIFYRYKAGRGYSDEQLRQAVERLKSCGAEQRFDAELTQTDREFLRTNRIQP